MCRHACPTHIITRSDACSPIGRALIIELYRGGKSAFTETAVDRLYQCNLCGACKAWCKPRHELPRIIELAREKIVEEHRAPQGILNLDTDVISTYNVYNEPHSKRFEQFTISLQKKQLKADVIYFVGCTTAYRHPEIAMTTVKVLDKLGITVQFLTGPEGEVCCGSPLIRAGFTETATMLAQRNVAAIENAGIRTVLTTCPGCARTLKLDYPKLGVPLPKKVRVLHITEFLTKHHQHLIPHLTNLGISKVKDVSQRIIYHDPCHLGRELGVYNPPRQLLQSIPGTEIIEFPYNRNYTECCGGGGALPRTFPDLAEQITHRRLIAASESKATYLVSACPNCKLHFSKTQAKKSATALVILDIMELLAQALKEGN